MCGLDMPKEEDAAARLGHVQARGLATGTERRSKVEGWWLAKSGSGPSGTRFLPASVVG